MTSVAQAGSRTDRRAAAFLVAQAVAVLAWWVLVFITRSAREWFFPYGGLDPAFVAFALPDLVLIVGGSLLVARHRLHGSTAPVASGILLGAVGYGTLYTAAWTVLLHAPPGGLIAMLVLAVGTWRACR
ncbi:MAG TPA: hypothetical protein VFD38_20035 [Myxococcaceae bacterium]|nr:hypothetical protein [Myxococcaceae bacterium]